MSAIRDYALAGAKARKHELEQELKIINRTFPELAGRAPVAKRRRRRMSAAARKAISIAQKKRWAVQRKDKK